MNEAKKNVERVLTASGQREIDEAVHRFSGFEVVGGVDLKKDIVPRLSEVEADILLVGEGLTGQESLTQLILQVSREYPDLRIIYLAGFVDKKDESRIQSLGMLAMSGIYDIIHDNKLTFNSLYHLFREPKTLEDMYYLTRQVKTRASTLIEFEIPVKEEELDEQVYKNVFVISSIKPGTGKSFLSTNIATAIADRGVDAKGKKPRVAIIEADLQNLSIGTLLQIEDDKKHLKAVFDKIKTVVNEHGTMTGTLEQVETVNRFILDCFHSYPKLKNLEALVGSQLSFRDLESVTPYYYAYLIDVASRNYDVVIVDTNSSLSHVTTYPLLQMARSCYYILNLDFNNIRNNTRYKEVLREIGVLEKVRYVLNEDHVKEDYSDYEELIFTADHIDDSDFKLEARIPQLAKPIFLNRLYEGVPVVLDEGKQTLRARYEIFKVANQIWPIKDFKKIEEQVDGLKRTKRRGIFYKE